MKLLLQMVSTPKVCESPPISTDSSTPVSNLSYIYTPSPIKANHSRGSTPLSISAPTSAQSHNNKCEDKSANCSQPLIYRKAKKLCPSPLAKDTSYSDTSQHRMSLSSSMVTVPDGLSSPSSTDTSCSVQPSAWSNVVKNRSPAVSPAMTYVKNAGSTFSSPSCSPLSGKDSPLVGRNTNQGSRQWILKSEVDTAAKKISFSDMSSMSPTSAWPDVAKLSVNCDTSTSYVYDSSPSPGTSFSQKPISPLAVQEVHSVLPEYIPVQVPIGNEITSDHSHPNDVLSISTASTNTSSCHVWGQKTPNISPACGTPVTGQSSSEQRLKSRGNSGKGAPRDRHSSGSTQKTSKRNSSSGSKNNNRVQPITLENFMTSKSRNKKGKTPQGGKDLTMFENRFVQNLKVDSASPPKKMQPSSIKRLTFSDKKVEHALSNRFIQDISTNSASPPKKVKPKAINRLSLPDQKNSEIDSSLRFLSSSADAKVSDDASNYRGNLRKTLEWENNRSAKRNLREIDPKIVFSLQKNYIDSEDPNGKDIFVDEDEDVDEIVSGGKSGAISEVQQFWELRPVKSPGNVSDVPCDVGSPAQRG